MTKSIREMTGEELYIKYGDLVEKNSLYIQKKYFWIISKEEAIQVGWAGLLLLAKKYEPIAEDESNIEALISLRVQGAIKDSVRKITGVKKAGDLYHYSVRKFEIALEDLESTQVENILGHNDPEVSEVHFDKLVEPLKSTREKEVIRLLYLYDKNSREASEILEISESRVSQVHQKALNTLKDYQKRTRYAA